MITVKVNGEAVDCPVSSTVADLLRLTEVDTLGVAIAVNQQVLPRAQWHLHELVGDEELQLFKAIAGG
ncbi:sulfur carrier protein ThiS [Corallincola spongiicola]|uniref:Sulfur carrier protein ThiS n=1 Tax=Corallincola spongiicola TaxID=2520508 RepID=A0ABY1WP46_9GAMM|nr:sulfur carrier protein ThiS [Corallincola spongiicola]TAA45772.1 sulfur carrier protein ThiS [Corallincola spongiicola]